MFDIVYYAFHKLSGRGYVGVTVGSITGRFRKHFIANTYFGNALRKYGLDSFTVVQIDSADNRDELEEKESFWIQTLDTIIPNGYNLMYGMKVTTGWNGNEETRKALSFAMKGYKNPKLSLALKGRSLSDSHKLSLSIAGSNRIITKTHAKNIANSLRKVSSEQVQAIRRDHSKSLHEWHIELGVSYSCIKHIKAYRTHKDEP